MIFVNAKLLNRMYNLKWSCQKQQHSTRIYSYTHTHFDIWLTCSKSYEILCFILFSFPMWHLRIEYHEKKKKTISTELIRSLGKNSINFKIFNFCTHRTQLTRETECCHELYGNWSFVQTNYVAFIQLEVLTHNNVKISRPNRRVLQSKKKKK